MNSAELPRSIVVDTLKQSVSQTGRSVFLTQGVPEAFPDAVTAFEAADQAFTSQPEEYLQQLQDSQFSFRSKTTKAMIDCSLIPGMGSETLIVWAPFADPAPRSSAEDIYRYVTGDISKNKAAPNSWRQTSKSGVIAEVLKSAGREMPVLTIFNPLPSFPHSAFTHAENSRIRKGDFSPAGRLALEALKAAQDHLHGPSSETQLDQLHFHGASLGASLAVGAAADTLNTNWVRSVTAQELIVAPSSLVELGKRFFKNEVGPPDNRVILPGLPVIPEPRLLTELDRYGNEPAMTARTLLGISKFNRLTGLTQTRGGNRTPNLIGRLVSHHVQVMIPLAKHSGLTLDTPRYLPGAGERVVQVRALEDQRIGHLVDEHVAATALLAAINVRNS